MELTTTKYRLIFLPDAEYNMIMLGIPALKRLVYSELLKSGIENFHIEGSELIFIPDKHRDALRTKANKGSPI